MQLDHQIYDTIYHVIIFPTQTQVTYVSPAWQPILNKPVTFYDGCMVIPSTHYNGHLTLLAIPPEIDLSHMQWTILNFGQWLSTWKWSTERKLLQVIATYTFHQ